MFPQLRFFLGLIACIPLLPVLMIQGKRVRQSVPRLPEAGGVRVGSIGEGSEAIRLLTLGESTIAGVGVADHQEGITGQIAASLNKLTSKQVHWEVLAKSGYTARRVTEMLVPQIPEKPIDLIVIGLGGNDTFRLNTPRRWARDFSDLLQAIRKRQTSCPIIIADLPPVAEFPAFPRLMQKILGRLLHLHHLAIRKLPANFSGVYYMDEPICLENWGELLPEGKSPADFFSDGVHPSPLTYSIWGEQIARFAIQHLMSLILLASILISMGDTMEKKVEKIIFDFSDIADKAAWNIINDGVMGGVSNSVFTIDPEDKTATFRGHVSLANNGGFASVRTFPRDFQLEGFKGVMLRVKGDGNSHSFRFRVDDNFDGMSYRASFDTQKDIWMDIELPFESFFPTFRGRTLLGVGPLNPANIRQLGFLISDKQEGKFELTIDWIKAVR